jgi:excisionase family DNA binding protein
VTPGHDRGVMRKANPRGTELDDERIIDLTVGELRALLAKEREATVEQVAAVLGQATRLLDREGCAQFLNCSSRQVDRLVKEEGLPCYRVGESPRFEIPELLKWLREREAKRAQGPAGGPRFEVIEGGTAEE